jgi:flagellar basal-body rod modification protein FlgD
LLTTQLKNQDPLSPMDANQFTAQIVQMTGVEQQLLTNDLLKQLVGNTSGGVAAAVSLIGKDVRVVSSDAALSGGKAQWIYKLDSAAADVAAGDQTFNWDGKDSMGRTLPDGTYTLRIAAKSPTGEAIGGSTYIEGMVTAVEQVDGKTLLTINGAKVPWEQVNAVRLPQTPPSTQTSAGQTPADVAA